jgi:hypothetical protein
MVASYELLDGLLENARLPDDNLSFHTPILILELAFARKGAESTT